MPDALTVAVIFVIGLILSFVSGYCMARNNADFRVSLEKIRHDETIIELREKHNNELIDIRKHYITMSQNEAKRFTKILDEVSQVTGVDKVELPSFGVVYLNHSKNLREAMRALHMEDLSDGALD